MPLGVAVWLIILAVLVVGFLIVFRRMSVLVARTRDLERFQRATGSLDARLAGVVDPLVTSLDEIRRRAGDPNALRERVEPSRADLGAMAAEAAQLRAPAGLAELSSALTHEIERAGRAVDMVEHGLDVLVTGRSGRELEAQTALKRGTLNLRHAREASGRLVAQIATIRPADLLERTAGGPRHAVTDSGATTRVQPTYLVDDWEPDDSAQHPRM